MHSLFPRLLTSLSKTLLLLLLLGVFTGCPSSSESVGPSLTTPDILLWKQDGSGSITITYDFKDDANVSSLAIYDSVGRLLKAYPLPYFPADGVAVIVHDGRDLLAPTLHGTDIISLTDGTEKSYSSLYLRGMDPTGRFVLVNASEYYSGNSSPLLIADSVGRFGFHISRQWNQDLDAISNMVWTSPTTFSLILYDSTNIPSIVEFDTLLNQISRVHPHSFADSNYYYPPFSLEYSSAADRYFLRMSSRLISIDRKTGAETLLVPNSAIVDMSMTSDGRYLAYSLYDSLGRSSTHILNVVTGATGILPGSDFRMALSPNGRHFVYTTMTPGPLIHVASVILP